MPDEDLEAYESHKKSFHDEYQPQGATEENLVQALADVSWRLNRPSASPASSNGPSPSSATSSKPAALRNSAN